MRPASASAPDTLEETHINGTIPGARSPGLVRGDVVSDTDTTEHGGEHENQACESAQLSSGHLLLLK
jgi:hypothetical protein